MKEVREKRSMRLTTIKFDPETDEMIQILKRRKAQPMSVIIRESVRNYFAQEMRKSFVPEREEIE